MITVYHPYLFGKMNHNVYFLCIIFISLNLVWSYCNDRAKLGKDTYLLLILQILDSLNCLKKIRSPTLFSMKEFITTVPYFPRSKQYVICFPAKYRNAFCMSFITADNLFSAISETFWIRKNLIMKQMIRIMTIIGPKTSYTM